MITHGRFCFQPLALTASSVDRSPSHLHRQRSVPASSYFIFNMHVFFRVMDSHYGALFESGGTGERRPLGGGGGRENNRRRPPLRMIEQISGEQLLPVKMTRFRFIAVDKRSESICMPQLLAVLIISLSRSRFQYITTDVITSTSLFMDSTNRRAHTAC